MTLLDDTLCAIRGADQAARSAARERQERLTKPSGALGVLEDIAVQLAGIAGTCPPPLPAPAAVAVFAADHGVHAQNVTPWPQEVTAQMVANLLAGGAAVNAFAAAALSPDAPGTCIASHCSAEPGHAVALAHLGLRPLVDLGLRLGEGTGALLALPLVQAAARALAEVATYEASGVTNSDD